MLVARQLRASWFGIYTVCIGLVLCYGTVRGLCHGYDWVTRDFVPVATGFVELDNITNVVLATACVGAWALVYALLCGAWMAAFPITVPLTILASAMRSKTGEL